MSPAKQRDNFLGSVDALIIDLRENGGGDPKMVAYISSYLFDERTHLNDLYHRKGNRTEEFWTSTDVPGKRLGGKKPVFVLTARRTFSGAQEFTYNLKNLKRATIIGETTGGGAHPCFPSPHRRSLHDRSAVRESDRPHFEDKLGGFVFGSSRPVSD